MIATDRLILRNWRPSDQEPWAALNADPEVMEHFPALLSADEAAAMLAANQALITDRGWGLWAVERRADGVFLGFTGLMPLRESNPLAPGEEAAVDRADFERHAWGAGYASEAARGALAYGFDKLHLPEIVAFTATTNLRSQAVMDRIGMTRREDLDFDHPALPKGHLLERHVVWSAEQP
ncbi:MAG TPA: GNAT family N-acetyltransferase [Caulobacter sp.]|nr:GNAT family N-acetyltransferase [Caulobacter sp.]